MKKFKLLAAIILIFFLGILMGFFGNSLYMRHKMRRDFRRGPGAMIGNMVVSQLDLTAAQRKDIETISKDMNAKMESFFDAHRSEGEEIVEEGFARIKEHLDPDQQQKLDEIYQKMKNRHPLPRPEEPPPPPPMLNHRQKADPFY